MPQKKNSAHPSLSCRTPNPTCVAQGVAYNPFNQNSKPVYHEVLPAITIPTISRTDPAPFYLGPGIATSVSLTAQTTLSANGYGAPETPTWSFEAGPTFGNLTCTSCANPVFTAQRKGTDCLVYDVVLKANFGGLPSAAFYLFINSPQSLSPYPIFGPPRGNWWDLNDNDGYESRIYYQTRDMCQNTLDNHTFNEKVGDVSFNDPSYNWLRGPATGFPGYNDDTGRYWYDVITFYNDNNLCGGFQCSPTAQNPSDPLGTTPVHFFGQEFWAGSFDIGTGVLIQTDTLQRYADHARHNNVVTQTSGQISPILP